MVRPSPRSTRTATRCPYTALFRSRRRAARLHADQLADLGGDLGQRRTAARDQQQPDAGRGVEPFVRGAGGMVGPPRHRRDLLPAHDRERDPGARSEEHTSELQSLMRISYTVFCLQKINAVYTYQQYSVE